MGVLSESLTTTDPYIGTWRKSKQGVYYIERGRAYDTGKTKWINYHCTYADVWCEHPLWGMRHFTLGINTLEAESTPWRVCVECGEKPISAQNDYLCYGCRHD